MGIMYSLPEIIERLSLSMQDHEDRVTKESVFANLTVTQIHYLDAIRHFENAPTVTMLAEYFNVSKPTVTALVDKLEKEGYVTKLPSDEDKRVSYVHLTKNGLKISDLHDKIHQGYAENFYKSLNKKEIDCLVFLLNKVITHLHL